MQIVPPPAVTQPVATVPPPQQAIAIGPAAPAAPIEPARRVTQSRNGGRSDLVPQQQRAQAPARDRGRLVDLSV